MKIDSIISKFEKYGYTVRNGIRDEKPVVLITKGTITKIFKPYRAAYNACTISNKRTTQGKYHVTIVTIESGDVQTFIYDSKPALGRLIDRELGGRKCIMNYASRGAGLYSPDDNSFEMAGHTVDRKKMYSILYTGHYW